MTDLTVHRSYCEEHSARDHWLDEDYHCHGESLAEVESHGYSWPRHLGAGWFRLHERYPVQLSEEWQILAIGRSQAGDSDFDF
jgi:hypothetical protein